MSPLNIFSLVMGYDEVLSSFFQNNYSCGIVLLLPQHKVRTKFVFIPLLNPWRICRVLGTTTGGGMMEVIQRLQTGRNSDDHVKQQMSDCARGGTQNSQQDPWLEAAISNWWCGRWPVATVYRRHCSRMSQEHCHRFRLLKNIVWDFTHFALLQHKICKAFVLIV